MRWNNAYTPDVEDRLATFTRTDHGSTGAGVTVAYKYNESGGKQIQLEISRLGLQPGDLVDGIIIIGH